MSLNLLSHLDKEYFYPGCACFKGMRLRCLDAGSADSYIRLDADKDGSVDKLDKQEDLQFFNDDGTSQCVAVERNLSALDLCRVLAVKNRVGRDANWCIVEYWIDIDVERVLEDHEDVLVVHRQTDTFNKRFISRRIPNKYDFFTEPTLFFPREMTKMMRANVPVIDEYASLQTIVWHDVDTPIIFSQATYQSLVDLHAWITKFFVLKGTKILMTADPNIVTRFINYWKINSTSGYEALQESASSSQEPVAGPNRERQAVPGREESTSPSSSRAPTASSSPRSPGGPSSSRSQASTSKSGSSASPPLGRLLPHHTPGPSHSRHDEEEERRGGRSDGTEAFELFADLRYFEIFSCVNTDQEPGTPTGLCLRRTSERDFSNCLYFTPGSLEDQMCWLSAMRLAKYGKQLRDNYRAFKAKQEAAVATPTPKEIHHTDKSRVAMDFTGRVGRIVDDPQEAREIAQSEGIYWKKKWKEMMANNQPKKYPTKKEDSGAHLNQPWFHETMSREQASTFLNNFPEKDGLFIVRGSKSKPGCFVLTSKHGGKILHTTIEPALDKEFEGVREMTYSIDGGTTRFIDLYHLVWFYILNESAALPSKLLHWSKHDLSLTST